MATGVNVFHFGLNTGALINEAINVTSKKWIDVLERGDYCTCNPESVKLVFMGFYVDKQRRIPLAHSHDALCQQIGDGRGGTTNHRDILSSPEAKSAEGRDQLKLK